MGAWIEIQSMVNDGLYTIVAPLVGAWIEICSYRSRTGHWCVAPLVGAWIEISGKNVIIILPNASLPSWERGLKYGVQYRHCLKISVAPLVGAWIEINNPVHERIASIVAPLVGAWIEMLQETGGEAVTRSLPSWERGLKY